MPFHFLCRPDSLVSRNISKFLDFCLFAFQMLAKFAEDDRIEQMNAQRRRMKQQEHKRAVENLIEERRRQHEMDKVANFFN